MLQQTRVSTVIPYYDRFLARFPTVTALAAADEGDVLAAWSGLGYYRRARQLHRGARHVAEKLDGEIPGTIEGLLSIPGVGPYTAGAIGSLAFGLRAPLVDGNVVRVLSRIFAIDDDARRPATVKRIWALAGELVPDDAPGAFNEALMELGATVCTPQSPDCSVCPVASACIGRARGIERSLPVLSAKKSVPTVYAAALLARKNGTVLLGRRRGDALFGGMWEPPMTESTERDVATEDAARFATGTEDRGTVNHVLSHRRMEITVLAGSPKARARYPEIYDEVRFVAEADLASYGISTLARKVMKAG
jgi:A/G-specific adenine glycosylase